jgi:hypothetical protein
MARGVTLGTLLQSLRAELQDTTLSSLGLTDRAILTRHLQASQDYLYKKYSWSFLKLWATTSLSAGQRYYSIPSDLDVDRIYEVRHKWGNEWSKPLGKGITHDEYSQYNSDETDVRSDPVRKWDFKVISGAVNLEVWPKPATNQTNALGFAGKAPLAAFASDSDVCTLDSELLIKWTAARILKRRRAPEAVEVGAEAVDILNTLRANTSKSSNRYTFADGSTDAPPEKELRVVSVPSS